MANLSKATRLLKPLVAAFEDEDADKATDLCKQMLEALQAESDDGDADDAPQGKASDNGRKLPKFLDTGKGAKKAATPERNAMRAKMGLPPIGGHLAAVRREGLTLIVSALGAERGIR